MIWQTLLFTVFSGVLIAAALLVVWARNPVHSVLFLILAFFNAAGLFLLAGAEFLAMILVVVYVGAVAVLFLFVVMMLDIDFVALRQGFWRYMPVGALIGVVLLAELIIVLGGRAFHSRLPRPAELADVAGGLVTNTEAIGRVLYTQHIFLFQLAGVVLLVAMIGAIVLTLRHKGHVKRQNIAAQVGRTRAESIEIRKVEPGQGI